MVSATASHRNANLIATAAVLIAEIGQAPVAIYQPIATNPRGPVAVSGRDLYLLAAGAPARLDHAHNLDPTPFS